LLNFRLLASPERRLMFDINDFDETLPGPWEWDVKRLATSLVVAARTAGFDQAVGHGAAQAAVRVYREQLARYAGMRLLEVWYSRVDASEIIALSRGRRRRVVAERLARAQHHTNLDALPRLTEPAAEGRRFVEDPPLLTHVQECHPGWVEEVLGRYRASMSDERRQLLGRFRAQDAARKVVGVGSVGTRAWIVLMLGRDGQDPLFLQAKEAQASVLEPFLGRSKHANHGQRVVAGQRLMQAASDVMLGWVRTEGVDGVSRDFYIRQLWDGKGSALVDVMEPSMLKLDPTAIAGYLGDNDRFDQAVAAFAKQYADQNEADYAALKNAVNTGRVKAEAGL
jgi:uncharacterized protein (DUF2252 family)